jgi:hypothetical protein
LILVAKVVGSVKITHAGITHAVERDDRVLNAATLTTEPGASAVLVFSNGATLELAADTSLTIERYLQDPFTETINVSRMTQEPSASRLHLKLLRGEVVGHVKQLNLDRGSSFRLETPLGDVKLLDGHGVFRVAFRQVPSGQGTFQLSSATGVIALVQGGDDSKAIRVPQGQEISLNVSVTTNPNGRLVVSIRPDGS